MFLLNMLLILLTMAQIKATLKIFSLKLIVKLLFTFQTNVSKILSMHFGAVFIVPKLTISCVSTLTELTPPPSRISAPAKQRGPPLYYFEISSFG